LKIRENNLSAVFLLGAGATRGAISHVVVNKKRVKAPLNSDFFKVAETYARAMGNDSQGYRRLSRLRKVFTDEIPIRGYPTMEEAFSLLFIAKDFPEIYKVGPGKRPLPGTRKEIEDFLYLTFEILALLDLENERTTGYDRLATVLRADDTVVSLNYDTLLDSALVRRGWNPKVGYRLGGDSRKIKWKPKQKDSERHLSGVSLLKLHGSINWFVRGSHNSLSKVFESKPVRVTAPRRNDFAKHIRQIVPPIYGKIFEHSHWRSLWSKAFKALCSAEVFIVIGCSLIDTDFHLRALLSRVVSYRKQENCLFRRVILVAPTITRRKWQKALRGSYRATTAYPTFENFLRRELKV
jgi:hypothetical protein